MKEKIQPAEGIFLHITHTKNGDIITRDFTPFFNLSNDEIIELIETETQLYKMELLKRRRQRQRRNYGKNRIKIAMIKFIRAL